MRKPRERYIKDVGGEEGLVLAIIGSAQDLWLRGTYSEWYEAYMFFLSKNYSLFRLFLFECMGYDTPLHPEGVDIAGVWLMHPRQGYAQTRKRQGRRPVWD